MAGIKIALFADVKSFLTGITKSEEAVEDVSDSLDDMARDAQKAGDKAGDALADGVEDGARDAGDAVDKLGPAFKGMGDDAHKGAKEAGDAVEKLERSFKDLADGVSKSSQSAGDDVGTNIKHGTKEAEEGVKEFGDEANSTAKETAASFDGSAESITGAFQEIAANAFQGFGPAGAVAGLAAAAGIGIVTSKMEEAKEKAQETAEEVAELAGELIDIGHRGTLGPQEITDALRDMASTAKDGKIPLEELRKQAEKAGVSFSDYAQGVAGDSSALHRSYAEVAGALEDVQRGQDELTAAGGYYSQASVQYRKDTLAQKEALEEAKGALLEQDATLDRAGQAARDYDAATRGLTQATEEQTAAAQAHQDAQDSYADALVSSGDAVSVYEGVLERKKTAEQNAAQATADATKDSSDSWEDYASDVTVTTQDLIDEWNRQAAENAAFADNLAKIGAAGGQALADELKAKGPEVAAATAAAIATSDPATQQAAIDAHAKATGTAMAGAMGAGISGNAAAVQQGVDAAAAAVTPPTVTVWLKPNTAELDRELARPRTIGVSVARVGAPVAF